MTANFWKTLNHPINGLAPMHGVTTHLFRELQCLTTKPDVIYTEFVSAEGLALVPNKFSNQLRFSTIQKPIVAQLFGVDPQSFRKAITTLHGMGFDGIDINMGCPSSKVVKHGGGGALIGNYAMTDELLTAAINECQKLNIPLSLKTRIVQNKKNNSDWFKFLANYPITAVVIHGRYLKQEHSGEVNWENVRVGSTILKENGIIVLGNGGIQNSVQGLEICKHYNLDGYLIGQAAIGNPFVFSESIYTPEKCLEVIKLMIQLLNEDRDNLTMTRVNQFVFLSLKGWPNVSKLKQEIIQSLTIDSIIKTLKHYSSTHQSS